MCIVQFPRFTIDKIFVILHFVYIMQNTMPMACGGCGCFGKIKKEIVASKTVQNDRNAQYIPLNIYLLCISI